MTEPHPLRRDYLPEYIPKEPFAVLIFGYTPAQIRKFVVATVGVLGIVLTANLLPDDWAHWVSSVAAVLTSVATYLVPNDPLDVPGDHAAPEL